MDKRKNSMSIYIMSIYKSFFMNTRLFQMPKKELVNKYDPINLFLETCNYDVWFQNEELDDNKK